MSTNYAKPRRHFRKTVQHGESLFKVGQYLGFCEGSAKEPSLIEIARSTHLSTKTVAKILNEGVERRAFIRKRYLETPHKVTYALKRRFAEPLKPELGLELGLKLLEYSANYSLTPLFEKVARIRKL